MLSNESLRMSQRHILVLGDVAIECGVAIEPAVRNSDSHSIRLGKPQQQNGVFIEIPGGAWRINKYVSNRILKRSDLAVEVVPRYAAESIAGADADRPYRQFVEFNCGPKAIEWNKKAKQWLASSEKPVYRVKLTRARQRAAEGFYLRISHQLKEWQTPPRVSSCCSIVICDRDFGFRNAVATPALRDDVTTFLRSVVESNAARAGALAIPASSPWIIIEATDPLDDHQDKLLSVIHGAGLADHTVIVMSANSLKSSGIEMRDDLSLERAVEDLASAIDRARAGGIDVDQSLLVRLAPFRCVVIRLGSRGALIWMPNDALGMPRDLAEVEHSSAGDRSGDRKVDIDLPAACVQEKIHLVYCSQPYESQSSPMAESSDLGKVYGFSSILSAEIALAFAEENAGKIDVLDCVSRGCVLGLNACQQYFASGLGQTPDDIKNALDQFKLDQDYTMGKPVIFHRLSRTIDGPVSGDWTVMRWDRESILIRERKCVGPWKATSKNVDIAVELVQRGLDVLREYGVPYVSHIDLATADRHEIENYAGIANLITKYMEDTNWKKPLCLGVFGPPGCGKSFGIDQVVQAISGYKTSIPLSRRTINLSQFKSYDQFSRSLHQIRNDGLAGSLPLVFVDEFDSGFESKEYGWLKYLLAPMQDGMFMDGDEWFHLPRCILVFIGGQNRDFIEFEGRLRTESFIAAKGRDFISRLRHYLVVKGPDLPGPGDKQTEGKSLDADAARIAFSGRRLRRAMLLRSVLERNLSVIIETERSDGKDVKRANIDRSVIEAFLGIDAYKHGARSLEAIVDMSRASVTRSSFQRSSLPPEEQLELHVDAQRFLKIVRSTQ